MYVYRFVEYIVILMHTLRHQSGLSSPRKTAGSSKSSARVTAPAAAPVAAPVSSMEDMVSSLKLDNIKEHLCPSLANTYEGLPLLE